MKKALFISAVMVGICAAVYAGIHAVGPEKILTALNRSQLLATVCDVPGAACGGQIVSIIPCAGSGVVAANIRPAGGTDASGPLVYYIFQVTPYLYFIPTHPGQYFVAKTTGQYKCMDPSRPDRALFTSPGSFFYGTSI